MNRHINTAKTYVIAHKNEFIVGAAAILIITALVIAVIVFVRSSVPKVVYQPVSACDLFTRTEAEKLLGSKVINSKIDAPVITGNTATSKCGYTDGNLDLDTMIVAAIIVRSGINDKGVQQNKSEFIAGWPSQNVETVKNIGDSAYFNHALGQLNILHDRQWIIISYGAGSAPEANSLDKAIELSRSILNENEV